MDVPFVDLKAQYATLHDEIDRTLVGVVASGHFILGPEVQRFEAAFAAYCGARHAVGVDSGTSALELILRSLDIGPGDEVITAANTFIATVLAIYATGARPVLADIDPISYTLAPQEIERAITARTRAVMPVHLYGQPADMDAIRALAERHGLAVIEDACQAHGARYKGQRVGTLGQAAAFSFYPAKNLGAYGDGGMVVTNSDEIAESVRMLRDYGQRAKYVHLIKGFNHRLDALQAAALQVKLAHLDDWNAARRAHAQAYEQALAESGLILPATAAYAEHVFHLYVVRTPYREALQAHLKQHGVATGIHYPVPVHLQPACQDLGYRVHDFPVTEQCAETALSLPMYAELSSEQIAYVAQQVMAFAANTERERIRAPHLLG